MQSKHLLPEKLMSELPKDVGNYPGEGHSDKGKQLCKDTEMGDNADC